MAHADLDIEHVLLLELLHRSHRRILALLQLAFLVCTVRSTDGRQDVSEGQQRQVHSLLHSRMLTDAEQLQSDSEQIQLENEAAADRAAVLTQQSQTTTSRVNM